MGRLLNNVNKDNVGCPGLPVIGIFLAWVTRRLGGNNNIVIAIFHQTLVFVKELPIHGTKCFSVLVNTLDYELNLERYYNITEI